MDNEIKPRILITEDDSENQRFLRMFLQKSFAVDLCDSDITFYDKLSANRYDVILMDISLKGNKNGLLGWIGNHNIGMRTIPAIPVPSAAPKRPEKEPERKRERLWIL